MGFCSCTVKFLLIIFNLVCAVAGLAILAMGVVSNSHGGNFKTLLHGQISTVAIGIIVLGAIVFLIAFFGCCGAMREDTCMIQTYGVILLAILVVEIALGITAFVYKGKVVKEIDHAGSDFFNHYATNSASIDDIQKEMKCCGYKTFDDYDPKPIPASCCPKGTASCTKSFAFKKGCRDSIKEEVKSILAGVGGVAIGIGVIELLGVICAFYVAGSIRKSQRRGYA